LKGPENSAADALSRLPFQEKKDDIIPSLNSSENINLIDNKDTSGSNKIHVLSKVSEVYDLFIDYPSDHPNYPLAFNLLQQA